MINLTQQHKPLSRRLPRRIPDPEHARYLRSRTIWDRHVACVPGEEVCVEVIPQDWEAGVHLSCGAAG